MEAYKIPERNLDGVRFEAARRAVGTKFDELHDELSACYYDHWRQGESAPFQVYDIILGDPEATKAQFDSLHGLICELQQLALAEYNDKQAQPDEELSRWFDEMEPAGESLPPSEPITRRELAQQTVAEFNAAGYGLTAEVQKV